MENHDDIIEGSLEVKLPTKWTDEKQSRAEAERRERLEERRSEKRKSQKKEDADGRKGRKVAKHFVFPMICGSGGSKSRLAKAAGAGPAGQMRDEKLHAVVARITFPSQNVQNTSASDHFWKLRCRKSARRCGAKHISKSKCTKHTIVGPLLQVEMSKKCTALWHGAHFEVKMLKTLGFGPLLEVQMSLRVAGARDCAPCQKWAKRAGIVAFSTTTTTTPHYTPIHYTQLHSITVHYITLHYTPLHYAAWHYTTLHYTTLHYTTLHYLPLHYYTTLHYATFLYTSLHYTTLHSTTLQLQLHNYTPLH